MTEIFEDIPDKVKKQAEFVFNMAMRSSTFLGAVNALKNYTDTCVSDREREFVEFYFKTRIEQFKNEQ